MKRYMAFHGWHYYPDGGMEDFIGDFDSIEEAVAALNERIGLNSEWSHLYDTVERKIICQQSYGTCRDPS